MSSQSLAFNVFGRDNGASRVFDKVGNSAERAGSRMARIGRGIAKATSVAGAGLVGLAVAGATMGVKTAAGLEQADIAFETLLHSGAKAQAFLGRLKAFAAKTPFELPGLINASRQLVGVGQSAKSVIPTLKAWGDTAGALGISQEAFDRAMLAVTQSMSKGKVQAEELMQITEAGIPIWPLLSRAMGKTVPQLQQLSSQGKLLAKDVFPALEKQMGKDYGGAMEKQSRTLTGLWSTFMDTLNIGLADSIKPLMPMLQRALPAATDKVGEALRRFAGWMKDDAVPAISDFVDWTKLELLPAARELGDGIRTDVIPALRDLVVVVTSLVLPAIGPLAHIFGEVARFAGGLSLPVQAAGVSFFGAGLMARNAAPHFAGAGKALGEVATGIGLIANAPRYGETRLSALRTAMTGFGGPRGAGAAFKGAMSGAMGVVGGPWGVAFAGAVSVVGAFAAKHAAAKRRVEGLTTALEADSGALERNTRLQVISNLEKEGVLKKARELGVNLKDVTDATMGNVEAQKRVNVALRAYVRNVDGANAGTRQSGVAGSDARQKVDLFRKSVGSANGELRESITAYRRTRDALGELGDEAFSVGENFAESLASGISAGGRVAESAALGVARKVAASARAGFLISSPSKVGIRIGAFFSKGVAIGISVAGARAADAAGHLAETVHNRAVKALDRVKNKLSELRDASRSMASSVAESVRSSFDPTQWKTKGGMLQGLHAAAAKAKQFAQALAQLVKRHVAPALVAQIAQAGPDEGLAAARAFLSMGKGELGQANRDYAAINKYAAQAGRTVADANFKTQIGHYKRLEHQLARLVNLTEKGKAELVVKNDKLLIRWIEEQTDKNGRR